MTTTNTSFADLLASAVTEPGIILKAYRRSITIPLEINCSPGPNALRA
jgi:hypothetical protein